MQDLRMLAQVKTCHVILRCFGFTLMAMGAVSEEFSDVVEFASSYHPGYSVSVPLRRSKLEANRLIKRVTHLLAREIRWNQELGKTWVSVMSGVKI